MKQKHIAGAGLGLFVLATNVGAEAVGFEKYVYDSAGNIIEKTIDGQVTRFDFNGNTPESSSSGRAFRHDDAGRLVEEFRDGRLVRSICYRYGDKVTLVQSGVEETEFFYNAEGQLVGLGSRDCSEAFAWDGLGLVLRGERTFANEDHMAGGVPVITSREVTVADPLGTTLSVGETTFDSTAFGEGLEAGLFTGKPHVNGLDGFVFNCRNYSSEMVRWTTPDPSGFPDNANNYSYVGGDPVGYLDPTGLAKIHWKQDGNNGSSNTSNHFTNPQEVQGWTNVYSVDDQEKNITWKSVGRVQGQVWGDAGTVIDYGKATLNGTTIYVNNHAGAHENKQSGEPNNSTGWEDSGQGGQTVTLVTHDVNQTEEVKIRTTHVSHSGGGGSGFGFKAFGAGASISFTNNGRKASTTTGGVFTEK